jgi:toxin ParE1/3/4
MKTLRITPQAAKDIEEIGDFIASHNFSAAAKLIFRIVDVFDLLVQNPLIGVARPDVSRTCALFRWEKTLFFTALQKTKWSSSAVLMPAAL